jgi:ABC-type lipoprotein export system ATPase subunit
MTCVLKKESRVELTPVNRTYAAEVKDLRFRYDEKPLIALNSLQVQCGESMAIMGPSGCGKTTLLHLLTGLITPESGSVKLLGSPLENMSESERDRFRGQHIGLVFQRIHLIPALSVRENVMLATRLTRRPSTSTQVESLLDRLELSELASRKPNELSQGQAQRVAIARALVHRPDLLIADEPTSALDDSNASKAIVLLRESARATGATLLVVTHDERIRNSLDRQFEMSMPL